MTAMTLFWLPVAVPMVTIMAVLLTPLLRRACNDVGGIRIQSPTVRSQTACWYQDQLCELDTDLRTGAMNAAGHVHARAELDRRLLDDTAGIASTLQVRPDRRPVLPAVVLLAALPTSVVLLYQHLGKPASLRMPGDIATAARNDHTDGGVQVKSMMNSPAQRLRGTSDDASGRALLARSYNTTERPVDAVATYAKAAVFAPKVANLCADYADAPVTVQGGTLAGAPIEQVCLALRADPDEPKALALAVSAAVERGDVSDVIAHWECLYQLLPPESIGAKQIVTNLTAARVDQQKASRIK